ncbi:mannose-1-phosphate guanylyltransferase [Enemella dayhoffiae]|uniref:Mannose-1-phosphate guanylyltransferase n=1 Tax=Enemella dayhoffiae TaxID=2016507 RepID=A0A255GYX7_9ACTN|nr:mannose-1-phosphate guanylyltransferase [Enemella dayhoffiae]OYO20817.1 mannose-1-phosphate guanylyltransferase [Enemella dayhoffiae]
MRYVVIMAGGSGKRLWPLSRQGMPKQMLHLVGDRSLLRMAFERVVDVVGAERVWVCTGGEYAEVVRAELPELPHDNVLGEPVGRDSLNAVAWPAAVLAEQDPDAVVAMVTADQIMQPVEVFRKALRTGFEVAETEPSALVTFGVVPNTPHTGYGYLHQGEAVNGDDNVRHVLEFKEKPDRLTAERYVASGEYWWNAGMFVWRAETLLAQLERLVPDGHRTVRTLAAEPERLAELFPTLPKISVDYAVMEPVSLGRGTEGAHVVAVRLPITWHDVGGFPALAEHLPHDADENAREGRTVIMDGSHNLVINKGSDGKLVAVLGMTDTIVVQTDDITLVCPSGKAEQVKALVARVAEEQGESYA